MIASRLAAVFASGLVLTGLVLAGPASAGTSLVIDASSGEVLSSENASQAWHPASTTKMMTAYLALKAVREGRIGLETAIPASKRAASQPRVKVYIRAGQEITLDNALRIMFVKSANDIAYVIAEGVGGDVETFVAMMNAEAQRLGMRDSHFTNPNGWHDPDQQVSARDLAILAMALMREFPDYSDYWNTAAVQLGKQVLQNTNGLVGRYSGIGGMKTGFVCASGFNVVATATRGGRTLIAVVLGALSGTERTVRAAQLLDEGFSRWGGSGYTVASLPSGSGGHASNICDDVRRKGGGVALADDGDSSGPISQAVPGPGGNAEGTSDRFALAGAQSGAAGTLLSRSASGRIVLGPRAKVAPVPVAFGRTPGSASAPLAANVTIQPDSRVASGHAGRAGARAGRSRAHRRRLVPHRLRQRRDPGRDDAPSRRPAPRPPTSGPMRLQGAIKPGAATATSLRPGAAAGIRPANRAPAKPVLAKPRQDAKPEQAKAKPSQAAARPAKPADKPAAKPQARTKPGDGA